MGVGHIILRKQKYFCHVGCHLGAKYVKCLIFCVECSVHLLYVFTLACTSYCKGSI